MCDIFNITLLEDKKELVAKVSEKVLRNYKNIPDTLRNSLDKTEDDKEIENKIKLLEIELALI